MLVAVFVTFLVEPLATFILAANDLDEIVKWLPTNASTALTSPGGTLLTYLDWWAGGLVLLGYAAVLAGLGVLLSSRRDIADNSVGERGEERGRAVLDLADREVVGAGGAEVHDHHRHAALGGVAHEPEAGHHRQRRAQDQQRVVSGSSASTAA